MRSFAWLRQFILLSRHRNQVESQYLPNPFEDTFSSYGVLFHYSLKIRYFPRQFVIVFL
jgi:hypothetical protein